MQIELIMIDCILLISRSLLVLIHLIVTVRLRQLENSIVNRWVFPVSVMYYYLGDARAYDNRSLELVFSILIADLALHKRARANAFS